MFDDLKDETVATMIIQMNMARRLGITPEEFYEFSQDVHGATEFAMQTALAKLRAKKQAQEAKEIK